VVSPSRVIQIYEAISDVELTHQESTAIAKGLASDVSSMVMFATVMWLMGMMGMMISKQVSGNPGNPDNPGSITEDITERAGLKKYEPRFIPRVEEERPKRVRIKTMAFRTRFIGPYEVTARRTNGGFQVRLYENLPGGKRKLVAYQVANNEYELERMFNKTIEAVHQVRFEHKTALRK